MSPSAGPTVFSEKRLACFSDRKSWNLGRSNAKLSYYDGMIQLTYRDGTPYNDEKRTPRATLITFLCDRDAGVGYPEYQVGAAGARVRLRSDGGEGGRGRQSRKGGGREESGWRRGS